MPGQLRIVPGLAQAGDNEYPLCRFRFTPAVRGGSASDLSLASLPVLDGQADEDWLVTGAVEALQLNDFTIRQGRHHAWLRRRLAAPADGDWAALTRRLFHELHTTTRQIGMPDVLRLWAVIPEIHQGQGDAERYKQFCLGRYDAYADLGLTEQAYPAATVIGSQAGELELQVIAATAPGRPQENPQQTSAYHYPREYGPRSPSFSRAMQLPELLLVSGTAAVRGSATQHHGDASAQLLDIFDNLDALAAAAGLGDPAHWRPAYGRIYLRDPGQTTAIRRIASQRLPASGRWPILQADICRQDLLCEIETALSAA